MRGWPVRIRQGPPEMKNLILPFSLKHPQLKEHWWHRLALVLFVLITLSSSVITWRTLNAIDVEGYGRCVQPVMDTYFSVPIPISEENLQKNITGLQGCWDVYHPRSQFFNFTITGIVSIVIFYLLQILYYKVVLYVIYGKSISNE